MRSADGAPYRANAGITEAQQAIVYEIDKVSCHFQTSHEHPELGKAIAADDAEVVVPGRIRLHDCLFMGAGKDHDLFPCASTLAADAASLAAFDQEPGRTGCRDDGRHCRIQQSKLQVVAVLLSRQDLLGHSHGLGPGERACAPLVYCGCRDSRLAPFRNDAGCLRRAKQIGVMPSQSNHASLLLKRRGTWAVPSPLSQQIQRWRAGAASRYRAAS